MEAAPGLGCGRDGGERAKKWCGSRSVGSFLSPREHHGHIISCLVLNQRAGAEAHLCVSSELHRYSESSKRLQLYCGHGDAHHTRPHTATHGFPTTGTLRVPSPEIELCRFSSGLWRAENSFNCYSC